MLPKPDITDCSPDGIDSQMMLSVLQQVEGEIERLKKYRKMADIGVGKTGNFAAINNWTTFSMIFSGNWEKWIGLWSLVALREAFNTREKMNKWVYSHGTFSLPLSKHKDYANTCYSLMCEEPTKLPLDFAEQTLFIIEEQWEFYFLMETQNERRAFSAALAAIACKTMIEISFDIKTAWPTVVGETNSCLEVKLIKLQRWMKIIISLRDAMALQKVIADLD